MRVQDVPGPFSSSPKGLGTGLGGQDQHNLLVDVIQISEAQERLFQVKQEGRKSAAQHSLEILSP